MYTPAFSNKIMSMVIIDSILIIFGYSEYSEAVGSGDGDGRSNSTRSDIVDCIINICISPNFQLPSNTSVIAMAFVNLTLKDIQANKEVLKAEISQHINDTIESLATGRGFNFSICSTSEYRLELPCPLINGIIIPPQNLTTVK
jgi:hypothetical protein